MISSTAVEGAPDALVECQHHWVIDAAHGPTSQGFCRRCGATREFSNSCAGPLWEDDGRAPGSLLGSSIYSLAGERLRPLRLALRDEAGAVGADSC